MAKLILYYGKLYEYGFSNHVLGRERFKIFWDRVVKETFIRNKDVLVKKSRAISVEILKLFHTEAHIEKVKRLSESGIGYFDYGDTPVERGIFEATLHSIWATVDAVKSVVRGEARYAFSPSGGYHHSRRDRSAGFCIFNDIGVAIEFLFKNKLVKRLYYIDIDAHHGDGIYYSYEDDPRVYIYDIHESGYYLYPGTGFEWERGRGPAEGTKINVPLKPGASDKELIEAIKHAYEFGMEIRPDIIILQAGADGLAGDPITHLMYTIDGYREAIKYIKRLADETCKRLVILGGGGYNIYNVVNAWISILKILLS